MTEMGWIWLILMETEKGLSTDLPFGRELVTDQRYRYEKEPSVCGRLEPCVGNDDQVGKYE